MDIPSVLPIRFTPGTMFTMSLTAYVKNFDELGAKVIHMGSDRGIYPKQNKKKKQQEQSFLYPKI